MRVVERYEGTEISGALYDAQGQLVKAAVRDIPPGINRVTVAWVWEADRGDLRGEELTILAGRQTEALGRIGLRHLEA